MPEDSGLVGLGGAGFPTDVKLQPKDPVDTLLINASECEVWLTSRARRPKIMAEATTHGVRATITLAIRPVVVSSERRCGEAETISFVSITYCLLF